MTQRGRSHHRAHRWLVSRFEHCDAWALCHAHHEPVMLNLVMAATIRLSVPGTLRYRDLAVRLVAEAARLVSCSAQRAPNDLFDRDVRDPFDTAVVSAFAEIFNNVAVHAYKRASGGTIDIAITPN